MNIELFAKLNQQIESRSGTYLRDRPYCDGNWFSAFGSHDGGCHDRGEIVASERSANHHLLM